MRFWIDTEFNEYRGDLISMALVAEDGSEWYESLGCDNPKPWVAKHVMPVINRAPMSARDMQLSLHNYLMRHKDAGIHIVADWPDDIRLFCDFIVTGPGEALNLPPITLEIRPIASESETPHNALSDAKANMETDTSD